MKYVCLQLKSSLVRADHSLDTYLCSWHCSYQAVYLPQYKGKAEVEPFWRSLHRGKG